MVLIFRLLNSSSRCFYKPQVLWILLQCSLNVNEFGALDTASLPDRARWLAAVRGAAERRCLGWTPGDYADACGFVARREGRERPGAPLLDALIPPKAAGRAP